MAAAPASQNVKDGVIGATSQQYPLLMASQGHRGDRRLGQGRHQAYEPTEGKDFFDTGVALVTDKPVEGVESISPPKAWPSCWG
jgi:fructose transport system substrate-binding protein